MRVRRRYLNDHKTKSLRNPHALPRSTQSRSTSFGKTTSVGSKRNTKPNSSDYSDNGRRLNSSSNSKRCKHNVTSKSNKGSRQNKLG